jgi:lycopene beta-cyclase
MSRIPPRHVKQPDRYDILILGGGLAGLCLGYLTHLRHPNWRLKILERRQHGIAACTWSFHESDLADIEPWRKFVTSSWAQYEVRFSKVQAISLPYHSINSSHFFSHMHDYLRDQIEFGTEVTQIVGNEVYVNDVASYAAPIVIDSRLESQSAELPDDSEFAGISKASRIADWQDRGWGFQKFFGQEVRLSAPHGLSDPILMDASVDQIDGYRFIYVLPLSESDLLIEDTYYSQSPGLDPQNARDRIAEYARNQRWKFLTVRREEQGCLPIPTTTARVTRHANFHPNDCYTGTIGMAAGLFHPVTGYSFPWAVRVAEALSRIPEIRGQLFAQAIEQLNREFSQTESFYLMLNRLMFYGADTQNRHKIFERFYQLPLGTIQRFYAGRTTFYDRVRLLSGKPPISILSAVRALLRRQGGRHASPSTISRMVFGGESR